MMLIKDSMKVLRDLVTRKENSNQHNFPPFPLFSLKITSPFANPLFCFMVTTLFLQQLVVLKTKFSIRKAFVIQQFVM